jgi:signal transduction histidine kinase
MPGTENEPGTGLGLKLCREFVEKLNGEIWVESVENEGSTFRFSIPVNEE